MVAKKAEQKKKVFSYHKLLLNIILQIGYPKMNIHSQVKFLKYLGKILKGHSYNVECKQSSRSSMKTDVSHGGNTAED